MYADQIPGVAGGMEALTQYMRKNLKRPPGPRRSGTVTVRCPILASGAVANAHEVAGQGLDPRYDAAAIAFVQGLPQGMFSGGKRNGQPADIEQVRRPITFR